jgi:hypothetical protein
VILGIESQWKWSVDGIEGYTKSGKATSHAAGIKAAKRATDKAMAPKKTRLQRPEWPPRWPPFPLPPQASYLGKAVATAETGKPTYIAFNATRLIH